MIQVLVTLCLAGTAVGVDVHELDKEKTCLVKTKVYHEDASKITPHACMMTAAKFASEWMHKNPGYQTRMIQCKRYKGDWAEGI